VWCGSLGQTTVAAMAQIARTVLSQAVILATVESAVVMGSTLGSIVDTVRMNVGFAMMNEDRYYPLQPYANNNKSDNK
jgi:hypothetical protein